MTTFMTTRKSLLLAMGASAVLLAAVVGTAVAAPANGNTQSWAYGVSFGYGYNCPSGCYPASETGLNYSINQLSYHYFAGASVIFTQTNLSSTAMQLSVEKVLAGHASLQVSVTNVTNGETVTANATAVGLYKGFGNATVITNSTVYYYNDLGYLEATPAVGLQEADSNQNANATITASASGAGFPVSAGTIYIGGDLSAQVTATFSPSLGLIPQNLYNGEIWNSTSTYYDSAAGFISGHEYIPCGYEGALGTGCGNNTYTGNASVASSVGASGTVWVSGEDWGWWNVTDSYGTYSFQVITLTVSGGLSTTDGVFLVPGEAGGYLNEVTSGPSLSALSDVKSMGISSLAQVVKPSAVNPPDGLDYTSTGGHFGIAGSNELSSEDLSDFGGETPSTAGPEPVTAAQQNFDQLQQPISGSAAPSGSGAGFLLIVVIAAVAVAVIVVAVLAVRGRKRKSAISSATPGAPPPPPAASAPPMGYSQPTAPAGYPSYPPPPPR